MYEKRIALRSLLYRKTQYISLFLVCMVGVAISLSAIAVSTGMLSSLSQKARIYYGGDFALMCSVDDNGLDIYDYEQNIEKIRPLLPKNAVVSPRMDFDARDARFFFEGTQALQNTIKGVDFDKEKDLISSLKFLEGGIEEMAHSNGVLISSPIAKILGVQVGDEIIFEFSTAQSQIDTANVIVKGIFQDSSVFGMYTSYMDFEFLRDSYGRPKNYANRICVHFTGKKPSEKKLRDCYDSLSKVLNMYRWVDNKKDYIIIWYT